MKAEMSSLTLSVFFEHVTKKFSTYPSLAFVGKESIPYSQLKNSVDELKLYLLKNGVQNGQKIILLGENSPNWGAAYFAVTTIGAVVVPILSDFPESDINHIIRHSEANGAIVQEKFYHSLDLKALENIPLILSLDNFNPLKDEVTRSKRITQETADYSPTQIKSFTVEETKLLEKAGNAIKENDLAEILYTSGTTGHSKGVMLTHKNIVSNALLGPEVIGGLPEGCIILTVLPLAHAYGCTTALLGGLSVGANIFFLDRKPSPKILMDALQIVRPQVVTGVPLIFEKIYHKKVVPEISSRQTLRWISKLNLGRKFLYRKVGKKILSSFGGRLISFVFGGASINNEVELFLREAKIPFAVGYGLSEASPLVSGDYYTNLKFGSIGRIPDGIEVRIDNQKKDTGVGEIMVKGSNVMRGYYKNSDETARVLSKDSWLRTGDLGYLDKEGYLFIKGRQKNVYVGPSGENIYPEIIEDKLRESLFVEEALVYVEEDKIIARIYPDYEYMESVLNTAHHEIQSGDIENILERIRKETNEKLPAFSQIKKIWEQMEPFEKTPTNKIKRVLYVPDYFSK
jgi:long-chain acyl-CoA synthetase